MITVTGEPDFTDYLRAQRFQGRRRHLLVVLILAALTALVMAVSRNYIFAGSVLLYLVALRPIYVRVRLKRMWQQTPSAHQGMKHFGFDEVGLHLKDDEGNPSVTHWDKFLKFKESKHTFFLHLSPLMYLYIPKRFMGPSDQDRVRKLLKKKIGGHA